MNVCDEGFSPKDGCNISGPAKLNTNPFTGNILVGKLVQHRRAVYSPLLVVFVNLLAEGRRKRSQLL